VLSAIRAEREMKMENIDDLKHRADCLKTIYVCLCLSNDDDPRREQALAKAKKAYDDVCRILENRQKGKEAK
jgi:hypothetical protein